MPIEISRNRDGTIAVAYCFGTLNEAEHHQALHLRVGCIDRGDGAFLTTFQGCERFAVTVHFCLPLPVRKHRFLG